MKVVIQRVSKASVSVSQKVVGAIAQGYLILLGVGPDDTQDDIEWLVQKIAGLRIFSDHDGAMNLSLTQINGQALVISQFTLYASTKKGNRPSFTNAAKPQLAKTLYADFVNTLSRKLNQEIPTGVFGADMQVSLTNDGPVTIVIDSKERV